MVSQADHGRCPAGRAEVVIILRMEKRGDRCFRIWKLSDAGKRKEIGEFMTASRFEVWVVENTTPLFKNIGKKYFCKSVVKSDLVSTVFIVVIKYLSVGVYLAFKNKDHE